MSGILSIVRNLLLALGSAGAVAGIFTEEQWATIVSAALIVVSAVWKIVERKRRAHPAA
jgi:hypothetical protein